MKFKFYENAWIPVIKGVLYLVIGLFALIKGSTFDTSSIFFGIVIALIGILYLVIGFLTKEIKYRVWIIIKGLIHSAIATWLLLSWGSEAIYLLWIIALWLGYSALTDLIEALILFLNKNILGTLFLINMISTVVLAYFTVLLYQNFAPEALSNFGLIAIMAGLISEASGFLFSQSRLLDD